MVSLSQSPLIIAGEKVALGQRSRIDIPVARLPSQGRVPITVEVIRGKRPGPTIWLSAALHGDEINGVEIIRRLLGHLLPEDLTGTLIACPVVNVYGFLNQSRYLPDRRDLNRCFPGSARGSLAARIAHIFMHEIVQKCQYGIDFHTASLFNDNLPQIRTNLRDDACLRLARAFGAPATLHSAVRDGSLRSAAKKMNIPVLLFEGGEPNRFNHEVIEIGVKGSLRVLSALKMIDDKIEESAYEFRPILASKWVRAPTSGILNLNCDLSDAVKRKQTIGVVSDAHGENQRLVHATLAGQVIGIRRNPLVYKGDAVVHVGTDEPESFIEPTEPSKT